ncbi:MAG TPA: TrbI/VirB10 family protein [Allosphingosinicella sp.]|jgi:type IV secretion system protein VirB10
MSERGPIPEAGAAPKQDPETLVLRGRPRPVVRFRRGLIIGITGVVAATVIAVTWFALDPPSFRMAGGADESEPLRKAPPDALAGAPSGYSDVPQLGPPLPGDLGRPILEHQRSLEAESLAAPPAIDAPEAGLPAPATEAEQVRQAAEAERQRQMASRESARGSSVLVQLQGRGAAPAAAAAPAGVNGAEGGGQGGISATEGQGGASRGGRAEGSDVNPHPLRPAPSPWTLSAGTIIPASLITGLNSDLPGTVLAQVTEPVRDSATGRTVLIPQGARLIGSYDNVVAFGQRRAMVTWQRIVLPNGSSVRLDNMPATDARGYAGVEDRVDIHTWRLLKGIALSTLLGVGTELTLGSGESDLERALRGSTQQNAARAGDQITQRNLDVQPTIRVRPGWPLRAIVHQDLVLRPWRG